MLSFLSKPYPMQEVGKRDLFLAMSAGLFVVIFLFSINPFSLNALRESTDTAKLLGFGLLTTTIILLNAVFIKGLLQKFLNEENWTIGKQLLWYMYVLSLVALLNFYYSEWLGYSGRPLREYFLTTLGFGLFLFGSFILLNYRYLKRRQKYNEGLAAYLDPEVENGENYSMEMTDEEGITHVIAVRELLYVKRLKGKVEVNFIEKGDLRKIISAGSFRKMAKSFADHDALVKIHKDYYANLKNVEFISENEKGYQLKFYLKNERPPLGRRYQKRTLKRLKHKKSLL